jgi:uncharacterized alkaline shock family protein YloU
LKSEVNIPEFTAQLQEMLRSRVQEVLGIEEPIIIRIHISKIVSFQENLEKKKTEEPPTIPFGYRK